MKIETYCPLFPGFYSTIFEPNEDNEIEFHNQENNTDLCYDDFKFDYADYQERVARAFVNSFESEFGYIMPVEIKYQSISSPQYYNFSNDSINIEVELNFNRLMELVNENKDELGHYIRENYTSRDGFNSFHSNNIEDWCDPEYILEQKEHRVGSIMAGLLLLNIEPYEIYHWAEKEMFYINYEVKNED
jgi:hypothetical protein